MLDLLNHALVGRYHVDREIGQGGMATVYLAHDLRHDRQVALKLLNIDLDPRLGAERFEREIRFAAKLNHPHILTVLDSGEITLGLDHLPARTPARLLFYTMPFIDGETLRARIMREGQLPIADAIRIARDAAQGIQHAHDQGIIHRDIKPENILLSKDGNVLVTDFGIARALDTGAQSGLTRTGTSVGTPVYMSPEQAAGDERVDVRTDIYSLGVILYEMLAGEPPYTGTSAQAVMMKRISLPVPSVRVLRPKAPRGLDAMLQDALAPSPGDRTATAAGFISGLDRAELELTDPGMATLAGATGSRRYLPILALTALALVGFVFLTRLNHFPGSDRPTARPPDELRAHAPMRLVVLPFENLGDTSDAYFADGLTDEVRGRLTTLPSLEVIARASSMHYARRDKSPREIAQELGVRYLLTGTVRSAKGADGTTTVQVRPELVEITGEGGGESRWQQVFDAPLTDVFRIQAGIADSVARALSLALPAGSNAVPTSRPEAWDAYLRARAAWNNGSSTAPSAVRRARVLYQRAVSLDSSFASAWGGVALTSVYLYANSVPTPALRREARAALERMRALDPDGAEMHTISSRFLTLVEQDLKGGVQEAREAVRHSPHDALLLGALSAAERSLGEWDSSLVHGQAAYDLDPRTASRAAALSQVYLWQRKIPEARVAADRALALAPTVPNYVQRRAMVSVAEGDLAGARQVLAAATEVAPADIAAYMTNVWDLGWVLDDAGQRLALTLGPESFDEDKSSWAMGRSQLYAWRGDTTRSRTWADSAQRFLARQLRESPDDAQRHLIRGLALARLGRADEARAETARGLALASPKPDATFQPFYWHTAARTALLLGDTERAAQLVDQIMSAPYFITEQWLALDPDLHELATSYR